VYPCLLPWQRSGVDWSVFPQKRKWGCRERRAVEITV